MLRCAKEFGLKARAPTVKWKRLASTPVPVIASLRGGGFLLITKVTDDKVVVLQPNLPRPAPMMRAEFETVWDGRLVVMTRRGLLSSRAHRLIRVLTNTAARVRSLARNIGQSCVRGFVRSMKIASILKSNPLRLTRQKPAIRDLPRW